LRILGGHSGRSERRKTDALVLPALKLGVERTAEDGSPPPVVVIVDGVTSRAAASATPPSPLPKSAVRPP
jgi:hypothetical protein